MRAGRHSMRRAALITVAVVLAAGLLAPLVNANRFRGRIQKALESSLNRHVTIGKVHLNLFTGPGFTLDDVLIDEAPGIGIEPFAHVGSMRARLRLLSLFTGHLAFSTLRLIEPSVNFVKADSGQWNISPFVNNAVSAKQSPRHMPEIEISSGRLNFKFGNTKSVFYVSDADLDLYANERGDLVIRFEGEPARTDHAAQGLGHLVARGVLHPLPGQEDELSMSVQLERTAMTELTRLFDWRDIGVRGHIASNLKLDGPLSKLAISGDLRVEDIHRWDLMPKKGEGWTLNYTGFLNVPAQQLDIETRASDAQGAPVSGKFVASNYLTSPRWEASLGFHDLPASGLLDTARHLGAALPADAKLDGLLNGEVSYSQPDGVRGDLVIRDAGFALPDVGMTRFDAAPIEIRDNAIRFGPAEAAFDGEESATLQADYRLDTSAQSVRLETRQLGIARTSALLARVVGSATVPILDRCHQGTWHGSITLERGDDRPLQWTGEIELASVQMDLPGFASPLRIASADVQLQPNFVQLSHIRGHMGTIAIDADYRYNLPPVRPTPLDVPRPARLRLAVGDLPVDALERLMLPTLVPQQGFFARALRLEPVHLPDWLKSRQLEGTIQVKNVLAGDASLGSAKARLLWNGPAVVLSAIEVKRESMTGGGRLAVNLAGAKPAYHFSGELNGLEYRGGTLDVDGSLDASGVGQSLLLNTQSSGTFSGSSIALAPETEVDDISGDYEMSFGTQGPRLTLSRVQVTQGQDVLKGQGSTQADGRLVLELTSGRKQVRMTGMLLPLHPPVP